MSDSKYLDRLLGSSALTTTSSFGSNQNDKYLDRLLGGGSGSGVSPQQPNAFVRVGGSALRTVAGVLEPLQLPKDVLDAILVGVADDDSSVTERLRRIQWLNYIPLGETPERPATGRELAEAMGMNETAATGVGFAWDIVGDPLLVGAFVSGAGKVARGLGALETGAQLMRTGRAIDRALSPAFLGAKANEAFRTVPGIKRLEDYMTSIWGTAMDARVFWNRGPEARTVGDLFMNQSSALAKQLPNPVPGVGSDVPFGHRLFVGEGRGQQHGRDVEIQVLSLLQEANAKVLGPTLPLMKRAAANLSRAINRTQLPGAERMSTVLRDTIYRNAFDYNDNVGIGTRNSLRAGAPEELTRSIEGVPLVVGTAKATPDQARLLRDARARVAKVAEETQFPVQEALARFDYFRERVQEADALAGYYASGYEPILAKFLEDLAVRGVGISRGMKMWSEVRKQMTNPDSRGTFEGITELLGVPIKEQFPGWLTPDGNQVQTFADMVAGMRGKDGTGFYGLDLAAYMSNLQSGHLKRVYGMFQSAGDYDGFIQQMTAGKVIPYNVVTETQLSGLLPASFRAEEEMIRKYVAALDLPPSVASNSKAAQAAAASGAPRIAAGGGATPQQPRGLLLRQEDLMQHLVDSGVSTRRAREAIGELIDGLSGNPTMSRNIKQARRILHENQMTRGLTQAATSGGTTVWGVRNEKIEREMLTTLGELASPVASLTSQARDVRLRLPWSEYLSQAFDEGIKAGYVKNGFWQDFTTGTEFTSIPKNPEIWGAFAGKYVHPFLRKELERLLRARTENRGNGFARVRSLITGGYLASPNVIAANLFGGIYTTAMAGTSPVDFVPEILTSWREFQKASKDPSYVFGALDDLKRYIGVNRTTLVDAAVEKSLSSLQGIVNATDTHALRRTFNGVAEAIQQQLDAPLGQKWAGLDGFQFVENLMKVSAFSASRKRMAIEAGIDVAEFAKPVAQRSQQALAIEAEAAELARRAVFDYSDLPGSLSSLRDLGLMLFPGFSYFILGRTLEAALHRPGALASADRISEAVTNVVVPDEDERLALYASMPEWLMDDQGVPMPFFTYKGKDGAERHTVIPFNQLIPTNPFAGNPLMESLSFGGIWRPLFEGAASNVLGSGEAPFSAKYGQRVFSRGADANERVGQSVGYLINSLAPGIARKVVGTYHPDRGISGGLLSNPDAQAFGVRLWNQVAPNGAQITREMNEILYSYQEMQTGRADKRFSDLMLSALLRSPQIVTTGGALATVKSVVDQSRTEMLDEMSRLRTKASNALRHGNRDLALEYYREIGLRQKAWVEQIIPRYQAVYGRDQQ